MARRCSASAPRNEKWPSTNGTILCACLVQVAVDRTCNDFAGDSFVEGLERGERAGGLGHGEWTHGRVTRGR